MSSSEAKFGELLHFAREPLVVVEDVEQDREPKSKPNGLWLSVGHAWLEWCRDEDFGLDRLTDVTRVVLAEDANILHLSGSYDLGRFTREFGVGRGVHMHYHSIDWRAVAARHDGIIIAPYCWESRHSLVWYYGWDVASGCIWRARAVAELEPVGAPTSKTAREGV